MNKTKISRIDVELALIKYFDDFFRTNHLCKNCRGFVPDGAIICVHCQRTDP